MTCRAVGHLAFAVTCVLTCVWARARVGSCGWPCACVVLFLGVYCNGGLFLYSSFDQKDVKILDTLHATY